MQDRIPTFSNMRVLSFPMIVKSIHDVSRLESLQDAGVMSGRLAASSRFRRVMRLPFRTYVLRKSTNY